MLDKFTQFIERHLAGPMEKLGSQRHLRAVRDGIVSTLPLIIVSSFFMILAFPPLPQDWGIYQFLSSHATTILLPYRMTMYIMSLYAAFGIGFSLARSYKLDGLSGGILATTAFLLTFTPINIPRSFGGCWNSRICFTNGKLGQCRDVRSDHYIDFSCRDLSFDG